MIVVLEIKVWNILLKINGLKSDNFIYVHIYSKNVANNGIGDEGISHLIDCKWPEVDFIHLSTNPFGDEGVKYLL